MQYYFYLKDKGISLIGLLLLFLVTSHADVLTIQCSDTKTFCASDNLNKVLSGKIKNMQTLNQDIKFNFSAKRIFKSKNSSTENLSIIPAYKKIIDSVARKIIDKHYPKTIEYKEKSEHDQNKYLSFSAVGTDSEFNTQEQSDKVVSSGHVTVLYSSAAATLYLQSPFSYRPVIYTLSFDFTPATETKEVVHEARFNVPSLIVKATIGKPVSVLDDNTKKTVRFDHEQNACPLSLVSIMNNVSLGRLITIAKMDDFISRTPVDRLCANLPGKHNYQSGHYWWLSADGKKIACIPHDYCSMSMPANLQSASMPVNLQDEVTKADNLEFSNSYNGINYGVEADNQQQYSLMLKFTGTITATPEEKYLQFLIKGINPGNTDKGDNDETNQQKSYVIGGLIDSSNCLLTTKTNQITVDLGKTLQPLNKEQNIYSTNPSGTIIELNAICSNAIISPYIHTTMSDFSTHDQPEKGIIELIADQPESKNNSPLLLYLYTDKTLNQPLSLTTPYKMSESKGLFHAQWYLQDKITASNAQKNAIGHFRRVNLELKYF